MKPLFSFKMKGVVHNRKLEKETENPSFYMKYKGEEYSLSLQDIAHAEILLNLNTARVNNTNAMESVKIEDGKLELYNDLISEEASFFTQPVPANANSEPFICIASPKSGQEILFDDSKDDSNNAATYTALSETDSSSYSVKNIPSESMENSSRVQSETSSSDSNMSDSEAMDPNKVHLILKEWVTSNSNSLLPTKNQKQELIKLTGIRLDILNAVIVSD